MKARSKGSGVLSRVSKMRRRMSRSAAMPASVTAYTWRAGVVALALGAFDLDETVGVHALERAVECADGDVGPLVDVLLLGEVAERVPVHRTSLDERAQDVETDAGHATTLA